MGWGGGTGTDSRMRELGDFPLNVSIADSRQPEGISNTREGYQTAGMDCRKPEWTAESRNGQPKAGIDRRHPPWMADGQVPLIATKITSAPKA